MNIQDLKHNLELGPASADFVRALKKQRTGLTAEAHKQQHILHHSAYAAEVALSNGMGIIPSVSSTTSRCTPSDVGNDDDMVMVSMSSSDANEDQRGDGGVVMESSIGFDCSGVAMESSTGFSGGGVVMESSTSIGGGLSAPPFYDVTMGLTSRNSGGVVGARSGGMTLLGCNGSCMGCGRCSQHHTEPILGCWACLQVSRSGPAFDADQWGDFSVCQKKIGLELKSRMPTDI